MFFKALIAICILGVLATSEFTCPPKGTMWIRDTRNCSLNHWCIQGNYSGSFYCGPGYVAGGSLALCQVAPTEYDWNNCKDLMKISEYVFAFINFNNPQKSFYSHAYERKTRFENKQKFGFNLENEEKFKK